MRKSKLLSALFTLFAMLVFFGLMANFLTCCQKKEQTLYIFNWTDYVDQGLIEKFEQEYNCKVVYDVYDSNENMLTKIQTSQAKYDIIVPSGDHVEIMRNKNLLHKIDKNKIPNYSHLDQAILQKAQEFDPGNSYAVPYLWGTSGFIYNKKYLSEEKMNNVSWDIISDPLFDGKNMISMLDDAREVAGAALIYCGYTPNTTDDEALARARQVLLQWDKHISHFDSDAYKNEIQDGTIWLGHAYNGDALQIMAKNPDIGFTLPKEGATLWIDSIIIPENSENKELAYKFINFLLDTENARQNTLYVKYATPVKTAFEKLPDKLKNNPYMYPNADYLKKCQLIRNIENGVHKIDKIWQEIRSN